MKITPKTQEEIDAMNLFPVGEYGFEVLEKATLGTDELFTKDALSKVKADGSGGNEMIVLVLNVFHPDGYSRVVIDYLLEAMPKKLRNACYACGLGDKYEAGDFVAQDFIGKQGNLKLSIQSGKLKDDGSGEKYPDKNNVADYILTDQASPVPTARTKDFEDEIPF